jgi:hypothetical protein
MLMMTYKYRYRKMIIQNKTFSKEREQEKKNLAENEFNRKRG